MTPGIHPVHKPVGPTSFAFMRAYADAATPSPDPRPPKLCHGGALEPFASGLLLILVGLPTGASRARILTPPPSPTEH